MYVCMYMHTCMHAYIIHTQSHTCMRACFYFAVHVCNGYLTLLVFTVYFYSFWCNPGIYTVSHKKTCHFSLDHNSHVSWWIFCISCTNGNRNEYSIEELQNLQLYPVSPHYLIKLKPHKTERFWGQSSQYFITQQQEWAYGLSELFCTRCVQKCPLFALTRCQPTLPLISSSVSNVLLHLN